MDKAAIIMLQKNLKMYILLFALVLLLPSCASTKQPMKTLSYIGPESDGKHLIIALRGIGGSIKSFEKYGFIESLHNHYPQFDVVIPDAHFNFYRQRIIEKRLMEEVFLPAHKKGYETIWLVGTSLGGLGSLLSMAAYDDQADDFLTGAILISPISGSEELHQLIKEQIKFQIIIKPEMLQEQDDKDLLPLWRWILKKDNAFDRGNIWLAYGNQDQFSGHDVLAMRLPKEHVITMDGKHKAQVFADLWEMILTKKPFSTH